VEPILLSWREDPPFHKLFLSSLFSSGGLKPSTSELVAAGKAVVSLTVHWEINGSFLRLPFCLSPSLTSDCW